METIFVFVRAASYFSSMTQKQKNTPTITNFPTDSNWVSGSCSSFTFEAKLFDDGSEFGINEGRVSKLEIVDQFGGVQVRYDRGWDIEPEAHVKKEFDAIMQLLENSPRRFDEKK